MPSPSNMRYVSLKFPPVVLVPLPAALWNVCDLSSLILIYVKLNFIKLLLHPLEPQRGASPHPDGAIEKQFKKGLTIFQRFGWD